MSCEDVNGLKRVCVPKLKALCKVLCIFYVSYPFLHLFLREKVHVPAFNMEMLIC